MASSAWSLADATAISGRLIGLLPERSASQAATTSVRAAFHWPPRPLVLAAVCGVIVALASLAAVTRGPSVAPMGDGDIAFHSPDVPGEQRPTKELSHDRPSPARLSRARSR